MDEPYLLAAARYVELNPVRARLAERPGDWRWSSARAHLDGRDDAVVKVAPLLALAPDWAAFLAGGLGAEEHAAIRAGERTGRPLGSAAPSPAASPDPSRQTIDPAKGRPELSIVSPRELDIVFLGTLCVNSISCPLNFDIVS